MQYRTSSSWSYRKPASAAAVTILLTRRLAESLLPSWNSKLRLAAINGWRESLLPAWSLLSFCACRLAAAAIEGVFQPEAVLKWKLFYWPDSVFSAYFKSGYMCLHPEEKKRRRYRERNYSISMSIVWESRNDCLKYLWLFLSERERSIRLALLKMSCLWLKACGWGSLCGEINKSML